MRWLTGTAEQADDEGFDPAAGVSTGRFRATHGDFYAGPRRPDPRGPRTGHLAHPDHDLPLPGLPRDPRALLARLRADGPEGRTAPQPSPGPTGALRSGLVPAGPARRPLRRVDRAAGGHPRRRHDGLRRATPRLALVHDDGPTRTELIIDPVGTATFAGERDTPPDGLPARARRGHRGAVHLRDDLRGRHPRWPARLSMVRNGRNAPEPRACTDSGTWAPWWTVRRAVPGRAGGG